MAHAMRPNAVASLFRADGRPHPLQESLLAVTLVLGGLAAISSAFSNLHLLSSWTGLIGVLTGAYGQFISSTTQARFGLIIGMGAAAIGFFIGMAHGGLFGGLIS